MKKYLSSFVAPPKLPYLVEVINTSHQIKEVELFRAYKNLFCLDSEGNFNIDNVFVQNGTQGCSYRDILWQSIKENIKVSKMYIQIIEGDNKQKHNTFNLSRKFADGTSTDQLIQPIIDPYQQQPDVVSVNENFYIDGFTGLITEIRPKTHFRITLFLD